MKFKRILAAGVSAAAVLGMAACGGGGSSADGQHHRVLAQRHLR